MADAVLTRLEAVTARLERLARRQGGGGGDDDEEMEPQYVIDFQSLCDNEVKAMGELAAKCGAPKIIDPLTKGFLNINAVMKALPKCKKPSQSEMMAFLGDAVNAIATGEKLKFKRGKSENHMAAFYETVVALSFIQMAPPYGLPLEHVKAQADSADFHLNRVLKKFKESSDAETHKAFVKATKAVHKKLVAIVKENFKTGLTWNPKGGDLASFVPGQAAHAAAAPAKKEEAKEEPKAKAAPKKKGGIANVFGELKKKAAGGDSAAVGMKKVTKDMKTKYRKKEEGRGKVVMKKKAAPAKKPKKPPAMTNQGGRWLIENYFEGVLEVDKVSLKQNAFICNCTTSAVIVKGKVKSVTIDSCSKLQVQVDSVISTVEIINCKSVTLFVKGSVPSITIDKSASPKVVLLREAVQSGVPKLITSMISGGNVEIPGKTEDADSIEIPLPEQYENVIDLEKATIDSHPTEH